MTTRSKPFDWSGKHVVITGSLRPLTRQEAISYLEAQGAIVQLAVTKETQILIVGYQQVNLFQPEKRSRKYQIATNYQSQGQIIRFLTKEEFLTAYNHN